MNSLARLVPMGLFFALSLVSCSIVGTEPTHDEPAKMDRPLGNPEIVMIDSGNRVESRGRVNVGYVPCNPPPDQTPEYEQHFCSHGTEMVKSLIHEVGRQNLDNVNVKVLAWSADTDIFRDIIKATELEPKIITMALSGDEPSEYERHALTYASIKGVLVLIASGNRGLDHSEYPAAYSKELPCVVSVSTSRFGEIARFYNTSASKGDIYIPQTLNEAGTSFSVSRAGAISLAYYRAHPDATCAEVKQALIRVFGHPR